MATLRDVWDKLENMLSYANNNYKDAEYEFKQSNRSAALDFIESVLADCYYAFGAVDTIEDLGYIFEEPMDFRGLANYFSELATKAEELEKKILNR